MREKTTTTLLKLALSPRRVNNDTAQVGTIIDTQGWESVTFHLAIGQVVDADATFAVLLEEGDNVALADAAPVADADMVSQTEGIAPEVAAAWNFGDDGEVRKLGYVGAKRYVRLTVTPTGNTGDADFGAGCRLGSPQQAPVVQTPS
jgi:hypothetical protein